jgi:uncharacterized membrane protein
MGAGVIGVLLAAVFGLIDWLAMPAQIQAKAIGLWHGLGNVLVVGFFIQGWFLRRDAPEAPEAAALVLSRLGGALGALMAWMGGELVSRLAVGVDKDANLNAPNSLSGLPAYSNGAQEPYVLSLESEEYDATRTT